MADERVESLLAATLGSARLVGERRVALHAVQPPPEEAQEQQADGQRPEPPQPGPALGRSREPLLSIGEARDGRVEAAHRRAESVLRELPSRRLAAPGGEQGGEALAVGLAQAALDFGGAAARDAERAQPAQARGQLLVRAHAVRHYGV